MIRKLWHDLPKVDVRYIVQEAERKEPGCVEKVCLLILLVGFLAGLFNGWWR